MMTQGLQTHFFRSDLQVTNDPVLWRPQQRPGMVATEQRLLEPKEQQTGGTSAGGWGGGHAFQAGSCPTSHGNSPLFFNIDLQREKRKTILILFQ